jgi:shikimate kinase
VVATGGGLSVLPGAMDRLLDLGTVVWLAADFDAVYARANRVGGGRARRPISREAPRSTGPARITIAAPTWRSTPPG